MKKFFCISECITATKSFEYSCFEKMSSDTLRTVFKANVVFVSKIPYTLLRWVGDKQNICKRMHYSIDIQN